VRFNIDTPNLDAMETSELIETAAVYQRLADYARTKATAQAQRALGEIPTAQRLEARCDALDRKLPDGARW
jgi:hypothetical protein